MPYAKLKITEEIPEEKQEELLASISGILSEKIGKPENYIMVSLERCTMMMSGNTGNAAYVEVRSIGGLNKEVNTGVSQEICNLLNNQLNIPQDRVYINFIDIAGVNWGWNGATFG